VTKSFAIEASRGSIRWGSSSTFGATQYVIRRIPAAVDVLLRLELPGIG
jgi:hypothetical protein